jgi:hypothetical protein
VELSEIIKLDLNNKKDSNNDAYTAFKDIKDIKAIKVESKGDSILN